MAPGRSENVPRAWALPTCEFLFSFPQGRELPELPDPLPSATFLHCSGPLGRFPDTQGSPAPHHPPGTHDVKVPGTMSCFETWCSDMMLKSWKPAVHGQDRGLSCVWGGLHSRHVDTPEPRVDGHQASLLSGAASCGTLSFPVALLQINIFIHWKLFHFIRNGVQGFCKRQPHRLTPLLETETRPGEGGLEAKHAKLSRDTLREQAARALGAGRRCRHVRSGAPSAVGPSAPPQSEVPEAPTSRGQHRPTGHGVFLRGL